MSLDYPKYAILNEYQNAWVISPGLGQPELYDTPQAANDALDEITAGDGAAEPALQVVEVSPPTLSPDELADELGLDVDVVNKRDPARATDYRGREMGSGTFAEGTIHREGGRFVLTGSTERGVRIGTAVDVVVFEETSLADKWPPSLEFNVAGLEFRLADDILNLRRPPSE
jgi:hypothetical protein